MAKTKISEFSATSADNTDITNINIAEGCSPANVNNAIRSLMSVLKNQQDGSSGDPFTVAGTFNATGGFQLDGTAGASGQVLLSAGGANTPTWGNAFVAGMIMMWSGTIATIPSGWLLCDGTSSTPDLRNRFVIGAFSDDSGTAKTTVTGTSTQTGGSKDAIVVSHTHTGTTSNKSLTGSFGSPTRNNGGTEGSVSGIASLSGTTMKNAISADDTTGKIVNIDASHDHTFTTASAGSSGTNANLVPYFALAFIMKS
jgi:hypothetical protein